MRILTLSVIISFLVLSCASKQIKNNTYNETTSKETTSEEDVSDKKALAVASLLRMNYSEAKEELDEAKKINGTDPEIYNIEGLLYFSLKQYDQAESSYRKAIELKPDYSEARNNLCGLYLTVDKFDAAVEQCSKAASNVFYRSREKALTNLGVAYFRKGDINKAEEYYKKSLEINPAFVYTHNELGKLYMSTGKDLEAIEEFKKAVNGYDLYDEAYYNLALAYLKIGKTDKACESFKRVVEISPDSALGVNAKSYLSSLCKGDNSISKGE